MDAARAEGVKKEAASKEVTRRAFEKIKSLEIAIKERDASLTDAADRETQLSVLLSAAQGRLADAAIDAEQQAKANEVLLADVESKETALKEMKASKMAATKQVEVRSIDFLSRFIVVVETKPSLCFLSSFIYSTV